MPPEDEQQQAPPKPKSSMMKILIPVILVLVLAGGGAFAYLKFFKSSGHTEEAPKKPEVIIIHEMDTFIVNLSDPGGKRFLKITMKAKMSNAESNEEFTARNFELRDAVLTVLTSKESDEIITPEDKAALKQQLIACLNKLLHKGQVEDLYFTDFLIQ